MAKTYKPPIPDWHIINHNGEVWYYSKEEIVYRSHKGAPITVPPYFMHNGGSIPWLFTAGLKPNGLMLSAYALHDYMYASNFPHKITRRHADKLLFEYGRLYGYSWLKIQSVYAGVFFGGWRAWKKHPYNDYNTR